MAYRYFGKNMRPFTAVCDNQFGRKVIYTNASAITENNIIAELNDALSVHRQNAMEIDYLDKYYRGDQPILYRIKKNRPEINNKVVVNIAHFIVRSNSANLTSEPIQFVLRKNDGKKVEELEEMNAFFEEEDKTCDDGEITEWRSICGTAYRYVGKGKKDKLFASSPFSLRVPDPRKAFVCYYDLKTPAFSCTITKDEKDGRDIYNVYTRGEYFKIKDGKIQEKGTNGNGDIPLIEYPNNSRRISDIELTILLTDEINKLTADRSNGIEQFVQAFVKFINCDIDIKKFRELREEGFFSVTSKNGADYKSDVDIMGQELDQSQAQVAVDDLFEKVLLIQFIANREGNTGGDTGSAVELRNGHTAQEQKAQSDEPIFLKSEKAMLRLVLNRLRIDAHFSLEPKDIQIKVTRSKNSNMLTKAETLKLLIEMGIDEGVAIKTVDLFSDPERVVAESKERIDKLIEGRLIKENTVQDQGNPEDENGTKKDNPEIDEVKQKNKETQAVK